MEYKVIKLYGGYRNSILSYYLVNGESIKLFKHFSDHQVILDLCIELDYLLVEGEDIKFITVIESHSTTYDQPDRDVEVERPAFINPISLLLKLKRDNKLNQIL